ncbi:hypothetical protein [Pontibacter sp. G13]|uniref:hypothetical protein n=1 Tax=Pontibacter sp. G13 TaxID=3074898 RepID=UPI00288B08BA|nr:hypothetical protein [Pontibacter sp. G13]WNJ16914.1 hypothetical protein RJD25_18800 [Pontibacter sp. G13]
MATKPLSSSRNALHGNLYGYFLPKGLVSFQIVQHGPPERPIFEIVNMETHVVPDAKNQYFFQYKPGAFTSEEIQVSFSEGGFLRRISSKVEDHTGDILMGAGDLGLKTIETVSGLGMKTRSAGQGKLVWSGTIDPFDEEDLRNLDRVLNALSPTLMLEVRVPDDMAHVETAPARQHVNGVFCKPIALVELILRQEFGHSMDRVQLPHPHAVHLIEIPQGKWVKTEFVLECNEFGYPAKVRIVKPSTAKAISDRVFGFLGNVLELPSKLIQLRITMGNAYTEELRRMNQQQAQLIELQKHQQASGERGFMDWISGVSSGQEAPERNQPKPSMPEGTNLDELMHKVNVLDEHYRVLRHRVNEQRDQG